MKLLFSLFFLCFVLGSQAQEALLARYKNAGSRVTEYLYLGENEYFYESDFFSRKRLMVVHSQAETMYLKFQEYETVYEFSVSRERMKVGDSKVPVQYRRTNPDGSESIFQLEQYADLLANLPPNTHQTELSHLAGALQGNWLGSIENKISLNINFERTESTAVQVLVKQAITQVGAEPIRYFYYGTAEILMRNGRKNHRIRLQEKSGKGNFELYFTSKGMETELSGFWKNDKTSIIVLLKPTQLY